MDITPPPPSVPSRNISYYLIVFIFFVLVFVVIFLYANRDDKQVGLIFDPTRQFIPKGAVSLNVSKALASFHFTKPLPFFNDNNVVQSLDLGVNTLASTTSSSVSSSPKAPPSTNTPSPPQDNPSSFLSYHIFGKSKTDIQTAFIEYFTSMGWKNIHRSPDSPLFIFQAAHSSITITLVLLDTTISVSALPEKNVIATLTMR